MLDHSTKMDRSKVVIIVKVKVKQSRYMPGVA